MGYGSAASTIPRTSSLPFREGSLRISLKSFPSNFARRHLSLPIRRANSSANACPGGSWSVAKTTYGTASKSSRAFHTNANFLSSDGRTFPSATFSGAPPGTETTLSMPASRAERTSISPSTMTRGLVLSAHCMPKKSCAPPASCVNAFSGTALYLAATIAPSRKYGNPMASSSRSSLLKYFLVEKSFASSAVSLEMPLPSSQT